MQKTKEILKEIEVMLMQAEIRLSLLNGELVDSILDNKPEILELQLELENIHQLTTKLENALLKKLYQTLKNLLEKNEREMQKLKNQERAT